MDKEYDIMKFFRRINIEIENIINDSVSKHNLTASQGNILGYLIKHKNEKICSTDIHVKLGLSRASVSATLKKLRSNNFILFEDVPYDDRRKYIVLTQKALDIEKEIQLCFEKMKNIIYEGFSEEEKENLNILMEKIKKNIKNGKQLN